MSSAAVMNSNLGKSSLGKVNPYIEKYIFMTFGFSTIIFFLIFFYWIGINYNYDEEGNLIKDSTYNNARTIQIVYLVFLGILAASGTVYYFY